MTKACRKCGREVPQTPRGRVRAHKCVHGDWCVPPMAQRVRGVRGCAACFASRQVPLPFPA